MKHCVIYNCLIPERLHRGVGSSPSLKAFPSSVSEPCGATFTDTATNRRVLHSQTYTTAAERVKGYCFPQDYRQKGVCFFLFLFLFAADQVAVLHFMSSYQMLLQGQGSSSAPGLCQVLSISRLPDLPYFLLYIFFHIVLKKNNNVAFQ